MSSRRLGTVASLSWVVLAGLAVAAPLAVLSGRPQLDGPALGWLTLVGAGNVVGLGLVYAGVARARVAVVASLASTEGALAALLAIGAGERPAALTLAGIAPVALGVALVAAGPGEPPLPGRRGGSALSIALGLAAASCFAVSLFAAGRVGEEVPVAWVALPARVVGLAMLLGALAVGVRPLVRPSRARFAIAAGVFEVLGILSFTVGAREGIAVTAVVASQFAALVALGGVVLFGERLRPRQVAGVAILAVGVALVALGSAA